MSPSTRNRLVALTLLVISGIAWYAGLLDPLRYWLYDTSQGLAGPMQARKVVIVTIDERTIRALDGYPLTTTIRNRMFNRLIAAGAHQVAWLDLPGTKGGASDGNTEPPAHGHLIIGMPVVIGMQGGKEGLLPAHVRQYAIDGAAQGLKPLPARPVLPWRTEITGLMPVYAPYPVNSFTARSTPLLVSHSGHLLPVVALQMFINAGRSASAALINGGGVQTSERSLWTDSRLQVYPRLDTGDLGMGRAVDMVSFIDVLRGGVEAERIRGKHILVGVDIQGLAPSIATPGGVMTPVQLSALTLASMIEDRLMTIPVWASWVAAGLAFVCALLLLWMWSLGVIRGPLLGLVPLSSLLGLQAWEMMSRHVWLDLSLPLTVLVPGALFVWLYDGRKSDGKKAEIGAMEIHRRVGLASQKRGDLDAAFESFRKCPLDDSIMVLLYYLALDYEKAENYERALAVYRYMRSHDPGFKDIAERAEKAGMYQDTVMMESAGVMPGADADISGDMGAENSDEVMLGRYRILRRIGKGAMGMVYLGEDPKINRTVAIKTLNLKQEFGADEQEDVLRRFFREAEAAGRLHHPNIVTIYDAGEVNDMAYIAMEFLTGTDLRFYTREDSLLPPLTVVKMGMKLADALAYAHSNDIVHRDIKAANVMYDPQTGQLKITDFGIARLSDSRRTKTGMVLGTPSSMSPEQLRGKKLDGRTDLYSLGVLMFQLLTGHLPYKADSLTQLMAKITSAEPPDMLALRPELKENGICISEIVYKLLRKDADHRYQDGKTLSKDLLACARAMAGKK